MKSILISIKPKYVAKILNGKKTIEIRKTMPKCDLPIDVYIYCTKEETLEYIYDCNDNFGDYISHKGKCWEDEPLNGKVVAKFTLNKVEEIKASGCYEDLSFGKGKLIESYITKSLDEQSLLEESCLIEEELDEYLDGKDGYAWHISNLEIFDRPKELSEFRHIKPSICGKKDRNGLYQCDKCKYGIKEALECHLKLAKAPQSFMFIESEE